VEEASCHIVLKWADGADPAKWGSDYMTMSLRTRKQELVREAIFDAAIDLFIQNGFNETTIEQIAEAAGISQRSFFRYFPAKDDLLAFRIAAFGDALVAAVRACPAEAPALEVIREVCVAGLNFSKSETRIQQIMEIAAQSLAARQANKAALVEVENRLSEAYAARSKTASKYSLEPRMLALMTLMVGDLARSSWFVGEAKDTSTALKNVLARLSRVFGDSGSSGAAAKVTKRKHSNGVLTS
jgi:AcrR family transcriptional regulator